MEILDIIKEAKQVYGDKAKEVIVNEWPLEAYDGKNKARSPFNSDTTASCMWNQKELCWKDFSSGRVIGILDLFQHKYGDTYKEAIVRLCEETGVNLPDDGNWTGYNKGELLPKNYRYPYITEQSFNNRKDVEEYLGKRGLSIATLDHFGIKEDEHKNIVFEFFDADNMLLSVKLRPSHRIRPSEPKMFWQKGSDNCPLLFNVNRVNFEQPLVITEGNCFPGDAQILTKHGWVNFEDYSNEEVMQVNPDGTSSFVMPLAKIVHEYDGKMVEASQKGRYYTFTTEEHNLVLRGKNGFTKRFAKDMPDSINAECASIPVCAEYNDGKGIPLSDDEIRLFVAFSADGSYNKESCYEKRKVNRIRFSFSKKRKFDRLKTILENLGIKYTETVNPSEKYVTGTSYYIGFTDEKSFLKKNFDWAWLSDMTKHQREVLLEEVCYWDGYKFDSNNIANPRNIGEYYSTIRSNAEFIQAMCHISGFMATIVYKKDSHDNHSTAMSVHLLYSKDNVSWQRMWSTGRAKKVDYKGMVYCVTVPSGMILVRQKEKISVSGNCDAMSVFEAGYYNVVSIPGGVQDTKWIEFNYKFLENFKQFIIWMDNDEAGQQGCRKIVKRLGEYNCKIVTPTDDVLDIIESYYQQYDANSHIRKADANNVLIACGGGMILNLLKTAKEIENPKVKRLMDYDEQQLQDLPRISTGFKAIDRVMYGNFENSLTVLTGKAGCVDCDTEFFNGHEWKRIADFEQGDKVLQYNDDGTAELVSPLVYVKSPCDKLWHFKTKYGLDQCLSDDHNVYYQTSKGNSTMKKFCEIRKMHESSKQGFSGRFYRTFRYDGHGISLTDAEIELMCAVICEGSFYYDNRDGDYTNRPSNDTCRFHIKKDRKKANLRSIFNECGLEYREVKSANDGYTDFYVTPPRHEKYFSDFWYGCSNRQLNIICDNILFWDGHCDKDGRSIFSTTVKESADFVQFAFSATGRSATIYTDTRSGQKYQTNGKEYIRKSNCYDIRISDRKMSGMTGKNGNKVKIEEYTTKDGFMYCFTVPSHKWVMRRNNKIVVTGNSGKSTWLNQFFIAEPLEAGERVLIYSGELPARILLGNILRPLASRRHIIELDNGEDQPKGYKVTAEASKAIKSYYRDNLFVFDDLDELETSGGGLLEAMEYSYKRYGITSYVIDNLMTVDMRGVDGESKIDRQIQFVKRLKKFTREYPVKVLLVAHARKLASGQADTGLDDISGASEIVKLCDRCYDVKVVHNDDTEDALAPSTKISVIKDRQAGRVGAKFELYFDECSSRIYTDEPERDKQYAWERDLWRHKKEIQYPEVIKNHIVANLPDRVVPVKVETADGEKSDDMPF